MASWGRHAWPRRNEGLRIYRERNDCYFLIEPDQKGPNGYDAVANALTGSEPSLGSCSISREWLYKSGATRVQWSEVPPVWQKAILPWLTDKPESYRGFFLVTNQPR